MSSPSNSQVQMVLDFLVALFDAFEQHRQELRQLAVEMTARAMNEDRQEQNRLMQSIFGTTQPLVPLVDVRTGEDIESFPTTVEEISSLDGNQSRRILDANDRDTKYPLDLAAKAPCYEEDNEKAYRMVQSLLRHGADPYAIFADQLEEPLDPESEVRLLFPGQEISQPQDLMAVVHHRVQRDEKMLNEDIDRDIPRKAFLESPEFMNNLKLEHRNPQGRTPFLSARRSARGADALLDKPQRWHDGEDSKLDRMGKHLVTFPPNIYSETSLEEALPRTAIQALLKLGADPLVTDNQGKHALHQVLDAPSWGFQESPPDHNGLTAIHSSIRRMWSHANYPYEGFYPLEELFGKFDDLGVDWMVPRQVWEDAAARRRPDRNLGAVEHFGGASI
ncbi:uncharacterized protein Triagg1_620 [Trichoderma aggressivum f. europaeum]|uniref:Ankyrin repeat protein n=1 Tax=Trichoderma aggressivum f. europaeum TaxID=173218 RepID=A0AAE1M405_9HYPO|nr:hypothetical protein Triagg1_620 [Trichoderma aggressivum f. europaeum]